MEIITIPFEESLHIKLKEHLIKIVAFKTQEHGNIKIGIEAPRSITVNREEIHQAMQKKHNSPARHPEPEYREGEGSPDSGTVPLPKKIPRGLGMTYWGVTK